MYKIVNSMVAEYLSSRFVVRSNTLTYNLRDSDGTLAIPQPRTNYCKRSLSYSGVVLWNRLPLNIRQSLSLNEFKSKLKNYDFDSSLTYILFCLYTRLPCKAGFYHFSYCSSYLQH